MTEPAKTRQPIAEVRISALWMNIFGFIITAVFSVALILLTVLLPHFSKTFPNPLYLIPIIFALFVIHELLHARALLYWGGVSRESIKFGFSWKAFAPYCHCKIPVAMRAYRITALFPLYILGPLGIIMLLIYPSFFTVFIAAIMICGSIGDIWIVINLRKFPGNYLVQEHVSQTAFDVYKPEDTEDQGGREKGIE